MSAHRSILTYFHPLYRFLFYLLIIIIIIIVGWTHNQNTQRRHFLCSGLGEVVLQNLYKALKLKIEAL